MWKSKRERGKEKIKHRWKKKSENKLNTKNIYSLTPGLREDTQEIIIIRHGYEYKAHHSLFKKNDDVDLFPFFL